MVAMAAREALLGSPLDSMSAHDAGYAILSRIGNILVYRTELLHGDGSHDPPCLFAAERHWH
jgi:hypothetical protein